MTGIDPNYLSLHLVLADAYLQAAEGKGKKRHADSKAFEDQPMIAIADLLNTSDGMRQQVIKKTKESQGMDYEAARIELLGAINYAAGIIIKLDLDQEGK